ncbi:MAG: hypothetical protein QG610_2003 [Euryarchaeota archaeon]|nr:hypothetical protein [Euryarchaeota archaeon]MDQ1276425.1 hypothetical protein [Euryarchaeota archaeon]
MVEEDSHSQSRLLYGALGLLVGAILTLACNWILISEQQHLEQKNIAKAIYIDVSVTSDRINNTLIQMEEVKTSLNKSNYSELPSLLDPRPYYSNDGTYYIYAHDISKLDTESSGDIYILQNYYGY